MYLDLPKTHLSLSENKANPSQRRYCKVNKKRDCWQTLRKYLKTKEGNVGNTNKAALHKKGNAKIIRRQIK